MHIPEERRILLSEDETQSVWLDLDTGQEIVEPTHGVDDFPLPSIESAIRLWVESLGVCERRTQKGSFLVDFKLTAFSGRVLMGAKEQDRLLYCNVDLGLSVPDDRRTDFALALLELHPFVVSRVSLIKGHLYTEQYIRLAEAIPTTEFIDAQASMVMHDAEVLHLVLANVIARLCAPTEALQLARRVRQTLDASGTTALHSSSETSEDTT